MLRHEGGTVRTNLARLAGDAQRPKAEEQPQMNTDRRKGAEVRSAINRNLFRVLHVKCAEMWATRRDVIDGRLRWRYKITVPDLWKAERLAQMLRLSIPSINLTVLERERPEENLGQ